MCTSLCSTYNVFTLAPQLFPGLIYCMIEPKVVFLVFMSKEIVLTGARVGMDFYTAFNTIYTVLSKANPMFFD